MKGEIRSKPPQASAVELDGVRAHVLHLKRLSAARLDTENSIQAQAVTAGSGPSGVGIITRAASEP